MDSPKNNNKKTDLAAELEHITREMYKKNIELVERNKTLSLLRRIDEVILGSVTNIEQIADQVASAVVSETGKAVFIYLIDEKEGSLRPLAVSASKKLEEVDFNLQRALYGMKISIKEEDNPIVKTFREKQIHRTHNLFSLFKSHLTHDGCSKIQKAIGMTSFYIFPLIVRGKIIGVFVVGLGEQGKYIVQFKNDLINQLPGVIGVAINNALLYKQIQEVNSKLQEIDLLKDEFVSVASHELRTPMTAIKSYLWMALSGHGGQLSKKQKFYLDRAYNSTDRLIKLVNDMLNISRIESGKMTFNFQKVDLVKLLQDIIAEVRPRAEELGISVRISQSQLNQSKSVKSVTDSTDFNRLQPITTVPPVLADPDKIKEVLMNLLGNSLKFTPKGGRVIISLSKKKGMVEVAVSDTGCGITAEDLPKLFQKFGLIHGSYITNRDVSQGTGLGLYICKTIIEKHGGQIWVESPGRGLGTTFRFTLKAA